MQLHWYTQLLRFGYWLVIGIVFCAVVLRPVGFEQLPRIRNWLHQLNKIPCKVCGHKGWTIGSSHYDGGVLCEHSCDCDVCGAQMNYFAYGNFEQPWTRTEAINRKVLVVYWKFREWRFRRSLERRCRNH